MCHVCHEIVKPETKSRRVAYFETPGEAYLGEAAVSISHVWLCVLLNNQWAADMPYALL
jgi:hypothetical protein